MRSAKINEVSKMKKLIATFLTLVTVLICFASCAQDNTQIYVISRESGSGTRDAFVELLGITGADGKDAIIGSAEKVTSTSTVVATVAGNKNAIGYISMGSMSDTVKALKVDGVAATAENVKNGSYKISRPFNICYKEGELSEIANDFVTFILSAEGQQIIADNGYIKVSENGESYTASGHTGEITLAGSTSVGPVMEKLADAYKKLNTGVTIDIQQNGSGAGIQAANEGACDIGMSSRDLKASELETLKSVKIASDGIAVIVNKENTVDGLTSDQIKNIYLGTLTDWSEASK